jgi:hypothetical protein
MMDNTYLKHILAELQKSNRAILAEQQETNRLLRILANQPQPPPPPRRY